jgi:hypothetical protein
VFFFFLIVPEPSFWQGVSLFSLNIYIYINYAFQKWDQELFVSFFADIHAARTEIKSNRIDQKSNRFETGSNQIISRLNQSEQKIRVTRRSHSCEKLQKNDFCLKRRSRLFEDETWNENHEITTQAMKTRNKKTDEKDIVLKKQLFILIIIHIIKHVWWIECKSWKKMSHCSETRQRSEKMKSRNRSEMKSDINKCFRK